MKPGILSRVGIAAALAAVIGCQDLNVPNTQQPDRKRALAQAADVEALVASQFLTWHNRLHNSTSTYNPIPLLADEMTGTYANDGALEISSEPRPVFNNGPQAEVSGIAVNAWRTFNSMISSANDGLLAIEDGLVIETGTPLADNSHRTKTFAKFISALGHGYLANFYDSSFVVREPTARLLVKHDSTGTLDQFIKGLPMYAYTEVVDSAVDIMEEAIVLAEQQFFIMPRELYFKGADVNSRDFVRLMHSLIARMLVYNARTPAERAAVDWALVKQHATLGITQDFLLALSPSTATNPVSSSYLSRIQNSGSFPAHADYKMVGPADTSGAYQAWIAKPLAERFRFDIATPDKRITGATPSTTGKYFRYRAGEDGFTRSRGIYHFSSYQWFRNNGRSTSGNLVMFPKAENDLLLAEAEYFLNGGAANAEALRLVNLSRTADLPTVGGVVGTGFGGGLPAVTAAGVPQSTGCVPRRTDGTCGSFYDALIYERTIEAAGVDAMRAYLDARGSDRLPAGTLYHIPLPAAERIALGRPIYTYGGVNGQDAAVKCTTPTLTCHPQYP